VPVSWLVAYSSPDRRAILEDDPVGSTGIYLLLLSVDTVSLRYKTDLIPKIDGLRARELSLFLTTGTSLPETGTVIAATSSELLGKLRGTFTKLRLSLNGF